jgi:hypothetical protein
MEQARGEIDARNDFSLLCFRIFFCGFRFRFLGTVDRKAGSDEKRVRTDRNHKILAKDEQQQVQINALSDLYSTVPLSVLDVFERQPIGIKPPTQKSETD